MRIWQLSCKYSVVEDVRTVFLAPKVFRNEFQEGNPNKWSPGNLLGCAVSKVVTFGYSGSRGLVSPTVNDGRLEGNIVAFRRVSTNV